MRIGELAGSCGLGTRTIRFYEQSGLLPEPERTAAGYRTYGPEAVGRLRFIRDAQGAGLSLAEIRGVLAVRDGGLAPCGHVTELIGRHLAEIDQRMRELKRSRTALEDLAKRAAGMAPEECAADEVCSILAVERGRETG